MESDIEVTRHHISMALPMGEVYQWRPNLSAYDMFDTIQPDLVICSHPTFYGDKGFSEYVYKYGIKCLVRYEEEGDILADNVITYTRYENSEFKEVLPSCADIINYNPEPKKKKIDKISIKNYVNPNFGVNLFCKESLTYKNKPKKSGLKVFRGYNVQTEWHCGDLPDKMLSGYVNKSKCGISYFKETETCLTSDVLNMLHCGITVYVMCKPEQEYILEGFKFTQNSNQMFNTYELDSLPQGYTNADRAKKIKGLLNVK